MANINAPQLANLNNAVERSSSQVIKDIILNNKPNLASSIWLDSRNKYLIDTIGKIKNDCDITKPNHRLNKTQLKDYIAISSILHCKDGWDFFSSAVRLLLEGNISNCIHMAYYAELRAGMSILASDGIGIFNNKHYWIDGHGEVNQLNGPGTHDIVWPAIQSWSNVQSKSNSILNLIEVNGSSIFDWLVAAGMPSSISTTTTLASDWMKKWSLDLRILSQDHNSRNDVSYRPQEIKRSITYPINSKENIINVLNKWSLCEPTSHEKFRLLDYYLLREALFKYYDSQFGTRPTEPDIISIFSRLGMSSNTFLEDFLLKNEHRNINMLFKEASKKAVNNNSQYRALPLIARAFLLLRISTAFAKDSLKYAGYNQRNLSFWWKDLGLKNGLWDAGNVPANIEDLWADVELIINDVNLHLTNAHPNDPMSYQSIMPMELINMNKFQKPYLWGIGL